MTYFSASAISRDCVPENKTFVYHVSVNIVLLAG